MLVSYCFVDDASVSDSDVLLRRVKLGMITYDPSVRRLRPRSTNFKDSESQTPLPDLLHEQLILVDKEYDPGGRVTPMSVYFSSVLSGIGLTDGSVLEGHPDFVLVGLQVGKFREAGATRNASIRLIQQPRNTPPQYERAHGWAAGKKTGSLRDRLCLDCYWIVRPSDEWIESKRTELSIPLELSPITLCGPDSVSLDDLAP